MTDLQKQIVIAYLVAIICVCTYVPWEAGTEQIKIPAGYAFIWEPPTYFYLPKQSAFWDNTPGTSSGILNYKSDTKVIISGVDFKRLAIEILAVTALFGIGYLGAHWSQKKNLNQ